MTDDKLELSRRKILAGAGSIGLASAGAGLGASAFFSDEETFTNNSLVAGELDAKAAYSAHYSDWSPDEDDGVNVRTWDGPPGTTGGPDDLKDDETGLPTNDAWLVAVNDPDQFLDNTQYMADGDASCPDGTDADGIEQPVIELDDVKPGDFGEVTFDFALCDNPGFVWLTGALRSATENGVTEPEGDDPDEDGDGDSTDPVDVELLDAVQAAVWVDDGDNYQDDEVIVLSGSLRTVLNELQTGPGLGLGGNVDSSDNLSRNCFSHDQDGTGTADVHSVSFAWWLPVDHANEIQTDSVTFDLGLYTEQCRHNGVEVNLTEAVTTPEMQQLLTDLGHPSPADPSREDFGSLGPVELRFDQARTERIEPDRPLEDDVGNQISTLYTTVVPSPVGKLLVTSTENKAVVLPPVFAFEEDVPEPVKTQLDVANEVGWPDTTRPAIVGGRTQSAFLRDTSQRERSEIETVTGADVDRAFAVDIAGQEVYVAPPVTAQGGSGPLLTDGGTTGPTNALNTVFTTMGAGKTYVLDPSFGIIASYTDEELGLTGNVNVQAASGGQGRNQCLSNLASCLNTTLQQGFIAWRLFVAQAWRSILALKNALVNLQPVKFLVRLFVTWVTSSTLLVGAATVLLAGTGFFLSCLLTPCLSRGALQTGPSQPNRIQLSLNPKGTFLRADFNPPPPEIIDLSAVGLSPGDKITIEQFGDTTSQPGGPEKRHSTIAVFSGSAKLLGPSKKNRVPDAIDAGPDADTPRTFFGNKSTNIPEDFRVANFDGSQSKVTVKIPSGATHLFIGIEDSESTDNTDPDNDYRVTITPK